MQPDTKAKPLQSRDSQTHLEDEQREQVRLPLVSEPQLQHSGPGQNHRAANLTVSEGTLAMMIDDDDDNDDDDDDAKKLKGALKSGIIPALTAPWHWKRDMPSAK
ncbi:hypothetical protein AC579_9305 [Pseudocercospora musae]|uniref:Uncharacterized protein n=1 Tax=Pseudocercospora musae TaxID=113226 RepID=A0A139I572_9PEZI|nr:hypothetical protein AC579_9305 [Pseudocercospora musae]